MRCSVLRDMAKVRKAETRTPLNKTHKLKRLHWAKKYLKTVLVWAAIIKDGLVGPFQVEDGLKINSHTYYQFLQVVVQEEVCIFEKCFCRTMLHHMHPSAPLCD